MGDFAARTRRRAVMDEQGITENTQFLMGAGESSRYEIIAQQ